MGVSRGGGATRLGEIAAGRLDGSQLGRVSDVSAGYTGLAWSLIDCSSMLRLCISRTFGLRRRLFMSWLLGCGMLLMRDMRAGLDWARLRWPECWRAREAPGSCCWGCCRPRPRRWMFACWRNCCWAVGLGCASAWPAWGPLARAIAWLARKGWPGIWGRFWKNWKISVSRCGRRRGGAGSGSPGDEKDTCLCCVPARALVAVLLAHRLPQAGLVRVLHAPRHRRDRGRQRRRLLWRAVHVAVQGLLCECVVQRVAHRQRTRGSRRDSASDSQALITKLAATCSQICANTLHYIRLLFTAYYPMPSSLLGVTLIPNRCFHLHPTIQFQPTL